MKNGVQVGVFRGDACETIHQIVFAVSPQLDQNSLQASPISPPSDEDPLALVYLRSSAKPFQAVPLLLHPRAQGLSPQQWAIICASHNGAPDRVALVESILDLAQATVDNLQCGPHAPLDPESAKNLLCNNMPPSPLHNNCSGKHAGMLLACHYYGWPQETYLDPHHPLQQNIVQILCRYSGMPKLDVAIDGCGAPVARMPLEAIARLFEHLVIDPALSLLIDAMTRYPDLVGDAQRIDTQLMQLTQGNLVAKVGADGMLGVGNRSLQAGLALKCRDGNNTIRDIAAIQIMADLGWITSAQEKTLRQQSSFSMDRRNTQDSVVGQYRFSRAKS